MERQLLTLGEVSELLRVSTKVVYRNVRSIPGAFKIFGSWRFDREVLLTELKKQATPKEKDGVKLKSKHGLL